MASTGFIDIHCHLLHGLDDGPRTLDVATQMCGLAHAAGTVAVVSTPHASHRFAFNPQKAAAVREELQRRIVQPLGLFTGCEMEVSLETLEAARGNPLQYTLNRSRYLLLELMPVGMPPNLDRVFARLLEQGVVPVVAHPERNVHLQAHPERLGGWVERGCLAQLTGDSLTGRLGPRIRTAALDLLRRRIVHFVASDGHDPIRRPPRLIDAYRTVEQTLSPALAELLFIRNPRAVVEDHEIRAWPAF